MTPGDIRDLLAERQRQRLLALCDDFNAGRCSIEQLERVLTDWDKKVLDDLAKEKCLWPPEWDPRDRLTGAALSEHLACHKPRCVHPVEPGSYWDASQWP